MRVQSLRRRCLLPLIAIGTAYSCLPAYCSAHQTGRQRFVTITKTGWPVTSRSDDDGDFELRCKSIIDEVGTGNTKTIVRDMSKDGVVVVRRGTDRFHNFRQVRESVVITKSDDYLSLQNLRPHAVLEMSVNFASSELASKVFRIVIMEFARFVIRSKSIPAFRPTLYRSLYDDTGKRYLTYVAEGKLVSGVFWHIYFAKRAHRWKITRLEYDGR